MNQFFSYLCKPFNEAACRTLTLFYDIDFTKCENSDAKENLQSFLGTFRKLFHIAPPSHYPAITMSYSEGIKKYKKGNELTALQTFLGLKFSPLEFRGWCHHQTIVIPSGVSLVIEPVDGKIWEKSLSIQTFVEAVGFTQDTLRIDNENIMIMLKDHHGILTAELYFRDNTTITHVNGNVT